MVKIRTYSLEHKGIGTIICESVEFEGMTQLLLAEVETIDGEVDIIDYRHGSNYIDVIINFCDFATAKAA